MLAKAETLRLARTTNLVWRYASIDRRRDMQDEVHAFDRIKVCIRRGDVRNLHKLNGIQMWLDGSRLLYLFGLLELADGHSSTIAIFESKDKRSEPEVASGTRDQYKWFRY